MRRRGKWLLVGLAGLVGGLAATYLAYVSNFASRIEKAEAVFRAYGITVPIIDTGGDSVGSHQENALEALEAAYAVYVPLPGRAIVSDSTEMIFGKQQWIEHNRWMGPASYDSNIEFQLPGRLLLPILEAHVKRNAESIALLGNLEPSSSQRTGEVQDSAGIPARITAIELLDMEVRVALWSGDSHKAFDGIQSIVELAKSYNRDHVDTNLLSVMCVATAHSCLVAAALSDDTSESDCRRVLDEIVFPSHAETILEMVEDASKSLSSDLPVRQRAIRMEILADILRASNAGISACWKAIDMQGNPWIREWYDFNESFFPFPGNEDRNRVYWHAKYPETDFAFHTFMDVDDALAAVWRFQVRRALIAALLYRKSSGAWPNSLQDAATAYNVKLPVDLYNGLDLELSTYPDGIFVLAPGRDGAFSDIPVGTAFQEVSAYCYENSVNDELFGIEVAK
jgi:hypothetical protein